MPVVTVPEIVWLTPLRLADPSPWTRQPDGEELLVEDLMEPSDIAEASVSLAVREAAALDLSAPRIAARTLRPYQEECIAAVFRAWANGKKAPVIVMGCGGGKTVVASDIIRRLREQHPGSDYRIWFLAHREELLDQTYALIKVIAPEATCGVVQGDRNDVGKFVTVGSVDTLAGRRRFDDAIAGRNRNVASIVARPPSVVILDECHHSVSPKWKRVIEWIRDANPNCLFLGMTATPARADGTALDSVFDGVAYERNAFQLIADGYLVPPVGYRVELNINLDVIPTEDGEFKRAPLSKVMNQPAINQAVVEGYMRYGDGRKLLAFCVDVQHAKDLAEQFRQMGIQARHIDGTMKKADRDAVKLAFAEGKIRILTSCDVITEGYDDPSAQGALFARPMNSQVMYVQGLGRALRLHPSKRDCIAEGQRVLTDHGLVPIELVTDDMLVWDGVEFVSHGGAVLRGEQETIEYAGLVATPDHRVWTDHGWRTFGECAKQSLAIVRTGDGGHAIRAPGRHGRDTRDREWPQASHDPLYDLRPHWLAGSSASPAGGCGMSLMREPDFVSAMASATSSAGERALYESAQPHVREIWGPWDSVSVRVSGRHGAVGEGEPRASQGAATGPRRQRWPLRARESAVCDIGAERGQQLQAACERGVPRLSDEASGDSLRGPDATRDAAERYERREDRRPMERAVGQAKRRVWDLLNCGPRHRFTVEGLLVSNCLVIDCVGNSQRHELVQLASLAGLGDIERGHGRLPGEPGEEPDLVDAEVGGLNAHRIDFRVLRQRASKWSWRETRFGWTVSIPRIGYFLLAWASNDRRTVDVKFHDMRDGKRDTPPMILSAAMDFEMAYGLVEQEIERLFTARTSRSRMKDTERPEMSAARDAIEEGMSGELFSPEELMRNDANWRERPTSDRQRAALIDIGVKPESVPGTAGEASDLFSVMTIERNAKQREPATDKQRAMLVQQKLATYDEAQAMTKKQASALIVRFLKEKEAKKKRAAAPADAPSDDDAPPHEDDDGPG